MTDPLDDHPIAELFELATQTELDGLAQDIVEHGQIETIDLYEGKILDGRNRYRACLSVGVEPRCHPWVPNGLSAMDYVLAKNLHRRHLTIAQRAALAVRLLDYEREEAARRKEEGQRLGGEARHDPALLQTRSKADRNKAMAAQQAAEKVGVGRTSVLAAELVAQQSPETFEKMRKGEISVTGAATEAGIGTGTYSKRKSNQSLNDALKPINFWLKDWDEDKLKGITPAEARKLIVITAAVRDGLFEVERALDERTVVSRALR